jgi:hypothetical protein
MDQYEDIYIEFNFETLSSNSSSLLDELSGQIIKSGMKANRNKLLEALCNLNVGLLRAVNKGSGTRAYRSMASGSFTGELIGYRPFSNAVDGLKDLGFLEVEGGFCPVPGFGTDPKKASRFKPTDKLRSLWKSHGINPVEWESHFIGRPRPAAIDEPIILKTEKKIKKNLVTGLTMEIPSKRMKVDPAQPFVRAAAQQVNDINTFFSKQDIQPAHSLYAFRRIFSLGDTPSFNWNKGGRLYAIGGYQQMKKEERASITINREAVVEIDVRASHLTILHGLKGVPLPADDPYEGSGYPRFVTKSWVAMTLGHNKRPGYQWSDTAKETYAKKKCGVRKLPAVGTALCQSTCGGKCLQRFYPMSKVGPNIAAHFPILDDWETSPWRWGDFQYIESQAVIGAVHELATVHGIPALPVHDSLIVPASHQAKAEQVLSDLFFKHVGVRPVLTVK